MGLFQKNLKQEAKKVVATSIGPITAEEIDHIPDDDPRQFLDSVKDIIAKYLGEDLAMVKLQELYDEFVKQE